MHLSRFTDYALRICLYLGARQDRRVSIAEIARAHSIPHSSVMKVVTQLVDGDFLSSTRGRAGGVGLSRPANTIRIGALARFMEGEAPLVDCATCRLRGSCGLVGALNGARQAFYEALDRMSLADAMLAHPRTLSILLAPADEAGLSA